MNVEKRKAELDTDIYMCRTVVSIRDKYVIHPRSLNIPTLTAMITYVETLVDSLH